MPVIPLLAGVGQLIFDPTDEATGTELDVMAEPYRVIAMDLPSFTAEFAYGGSMDTEGDFIAARRPQTAKGSVTVQIIGATRQLVEDATDVLRAKVAKLYSEGGTLRRVTPTGAYRTCDLQAVESYTSELRIEYRDRLARITIDLVAKPYWRGPEQTLDAVAESILPAVIFTGTDIAGDVPALGRGVLTDDQTRHSTTFIWGMQSRTYSADATADLFYELEDLSIVNGTAVAGPTGASGSGNNVVRNTSIFSASWVVIVKTSDGGAIPHRTHIGSYRVFARVYCPVTNTGHIDIRLRWSTGDFTRLVTNATYRYDNAWAGTWRLIDLGIITIPTEDAQWQGSLDARATVNNEDADFDCMFLFPLEDGYAVVTGNGNATNDYALDQQLSTEIRWDGVRRTNSFGTGRPKLIEGDYFYPPPTNGEGRTVRIIIKTTYDSIVDGTDGDRYIDDRSFQLFYTPRYLTAP